MDGYLHTKQIGKEGISVLSKITISVLNTLSL